ncbi:hypothetical protein OGAPHI_000393 [Ogataea philodendri]|uniref:Uncharacterized protein n=1 Tax=Ogataea philodendri TaxID=1378263 RepID=A0A9P8T9T8_9ASCO|nr:uncharacterized protein OGAPHI_000393 [Ogataea philodendri]KAH3671688.1 hypothetical protein OGAPHI_000393 [Ogataea philodendri]
MAGKITSVISNRFLFTLTDNKHECRASQSSLRSPDPIPRSRLNTSSAPFIVSRESWSLLALMSPPAPFSSTITSPPFWSSGLFFLALKNSSSSRFEMTPSTAAEPTAFIRTRAIWYLR